MDPHDTNVETGNTIYLETIINYLSGCTKGIKMIIIDACRLRLKAGANESNVNYLKSKFHANTCIAFSTSPNSTSSITSLTSLSAGSDYTNALVEYLESRKSIVLQDLFYYIQEHLRQINPWQIPMHNQNLENCDYLLDNIF